MHTKFIQFPTERTQNKRDTLRRKIQLFQDNMFGICIYGGSTGRKQE